MADADFVDVLLDLVTADGVGRLTASDAFVEQLDAHDEDTRAIAIRGFMEAILHGDETHRAWLREAADTFITGGTLPAVAGQPLSKSAAETVLLQVDLETLAYGEECERAHKAQLPANPELTARGMELGERWRTAVEAVRAERRRNACGG